MKTINIQRPWPEANLEDKDVKDPLGPFVVGKLCECGCGNLAPIANKSIKSRGWVKGEPLRFIRGHNGRKRIFVCSMGDLFHEDLVNNLHQHKVSSFYENLFYLIYWSPIHDFIFLTKRSKNMKKVFNWLSNKPFDQTGVDEFDGYWRDKLPLKNIWLGVSCENQEMADKRIPVLLEIPAAVRFVSVEPLLSSLDLERYLISCNDCDNQGSIALESGYDRYATSLCRKACIKEGLSGSLDWVICGGESGHGARPMHPDWVRSIRDQCNEAGVPFFFKQWGEWGEWKDKPEGQIIYNLKTKNILKFSQSTKDVFSPAVIYPYETVMQKVGKKAAGRLFDGRIWDQMPK
jgi:protein gp37